ncbi:MAG TPA: DUF4062 domain-containing protein [Nitrosomonas sp.]|nr:DUF4062 domain-containing protein [Nitrosomonas sp.]
MAKLRVFVSSTYYDLRHIRSSMEGFIESMGYEPVLFENGDIPFHHDISLAEACYNEVNNSHMLILIVGGRYGSATEERKKRTPNSTIEKMYETYNSVTRKEYETARTKDIPTFIFVERGVKAEYETFKSNRDNNTIKYAHVDSVNIFHLLDDILTQKKNNYVREFDKFEDIVIWLKEQWAGIFADLLLNKKDSATLRDMSVQLVELNQVTKSMKEYTESIMRKVKPDDFEKIITKEESKLRLNKAIRFREEPFIEYLCHMFSDVNENKVVKSATEVLSAFEHSKSLDDFLKKLKFPENSIERVFGKNFDLAKKEYDELIRKYLISDEEDK